MAEDCVISIRVTAGSIEGWSCKVLASLDAGGTVGSESYEPAVDAKGKNIRSSRLQGFLLWAALGWARRWDRGKDGKDRPDRADCPDPTLLYILNVLIWL